MVAKILKLGLPLKYLSNFWRILEMPLINCEVNLILAWYDRCFIIDNPIAGQVPTFTITDIKLYVPVVTLSTQLYQLYQLDFINLINFFFYHLKIMGW